MFSKNASRLAITAPTITTARMIMDAMRTGRSDAFAKFGHRQRTSMPSATGISTIANTFSDSTTSMPRIPPSSGRKYAIAKLTISGNVSTDSTELIAVSVMFSAMSPRNRWLYRLAVVPPGEAASSIIPTASTGAARAAPRDRGRSRAAGGSGRTGR